jgi:hypothetical protein
MSDTTRLSVSGYERDRDGKDQPEHPRIYVVGVLPLCLNMIMASDVIRAVEIYFKGGVILYLDPAKWSNALASAGSR